MGVLWKYFIGLKMTSQKFPLFHTFVACEENQRAISCGAVPSFGTAAKTSSSSRSPRFFCHDRIKHLKKCLSNIRSHNWISLASSPEPWSLMITNPPILFLPSYTRSASSQLAQYNSLAHALLHSLCLFCPWICLSKPRKWYSIFAVCFMKESCSPWFNLSDIPGGE